MTYILMPRNERDSSESVGPAAAGAGAPIASDVARWERFFHLVGSRRSEYPEIWTSSGLAQLAGSGLGLEAVEAHQVGGNLLEAANEARERGVPRFLEALQAVVVDELEEDAMEQLREHWEIYQNLEIGLVEPEVDTSSVAQSRSTLPWHLQAINVVAAHQQSLTGRGVRIGILDTGIEHTHPEFAGKQVSFLEFDPQGFPVNAAPVDLHGHGTHVAGIAAGANCGVAPDAELAVAAVLTNAGSGTLAQILAGYNWLVHQNHAAGVGPPSPCPVVNASLGMSGYNAHLYPSVQLLRILNRSLLIAAIGNSGGNGIDNHGSPGNYDFAVGVGSVDSNGFVNDFSDWGHEPSHGVWKPDVCAPGDWICSAGLGGTYVSMQGTSMAAPVVAGAAALLVQRMQPAPPNVAQVYSDLRQLVDPTQNGQGRNVDYDGNSRIGAGRLDLSNI